MRGVVAAALAAVVLLPIVPAQAAESGPLAGKVVVIDPGHQLGNANPTFARHLAQKRFNGSITKPCNTTGTATNAGLPESTFNWRVAKALKSQLEQAGATVLLTRSVNSANAWGPCIWNRPRVANEANADVLISIHGDGAASSGRGFHVIAPKRIDGWTDDIAAPSRRLARDVIAGLRAAGLPKTTYLSSALSVRGDESTLNFSDVPAVMVELGNMRNASDAQRMSSATGRAQYAQGLARGITAFLTP